MAITPYSYFTRSLLWTAAILFIAIPGYTQTVQVDGTLKDMAGKPVTHASVVLKNNLEHIIGFGISNDNGRYLIRFPDSVLKQAPFIEVNCLGYKKTRVSLVDGRSTYHILLEETVVELAEVQVKNKPFIQSKDDTLSYNVSSFARREDRTIGDVISRMPGMSVAENGQISYNGKNISNLYIAGDDLMDGRYGLATRTINKDMILSVDVMQRFQPVKVLKDKIFTDDVAVNLVLKDENSLKLSGQAMAGAGFPQQYDAALNAMLFNKKFKTLNSLKGNNSGIDYHDDFSQFDLSDFLKNADNSRPGALLSDATAADPDLPRKNYYINNSGVLNTNHLYNTKDSLQLKSNIQLFLDRHTFNYNAAVDSYLPGDTIHYNELQNALRKPFLLNVSLTAMANKASYYLRNNLRFNFGGDNNDNLMYFNGSHFRQYLFARTSDFSNDFQLTPALKNQNVVNVRWYVNYYNNMQRLDVGSGLDSDILNNNLAYAAVSQHAATPVLVSNLSAYYFISGHHLVRQIYQAGIVNEWQQLNSDLRLTQLDGSVSPYTGDAGNALRWQRNKAYVNTSYSLKKDNWEAGVSLPLSWQSIHFEQDAYALDRPKNHCFLNPSARVKFFINAEDYLLANYSYNNNTGNISGVYRGLILANYRSLYANDADLQEEHSSDLAFHYNFQRNIIMLFINAGLKYSRIAANSILSSILTDNVERSILLPYQNDRNSITVDAGISKYIFALGTTASLKAIWQRSRYNQFVNSTMFPFTNDIFVLNANVSGKFLEDFTFAYIGNGSWYKSRQADVNSTGTRLENQVKRFDQRVSIGYSPASNLFFTVKGRHIYSRQPGTSDINYFFVDANIRCKLRKLHTDLEFDLTNLFNIKEYKIFSLSSNQFAFSSYAIRGTMGIVRATFNL